MCSSHVRGSTNKAGRLCFSGNNALGLSAGGIASRNNLAGHFTSRVKVRPGLLRRFGLPSVGIRANSGAKTSPVAGLRVHG